MSIYKSLGMSTGTSSGIPSFTDGKSSSFDDDTDAVNEFLASTNDLNEKDVQRKTITKAKDGANKPH